MPKNIDKYRYNESNNASKREYDYKYESPSIRSMNKSMSKNEELNISINKKRVYSPTKRLPDFPTIKRNKYVVDDVENFSNNEKYHSSYNDESKKTDDSQVGYLDLKAHKEEIENRQFVIDMIDKYYKRKNYKDVPNLPSMKLYLNIGEEQENSGLNKNQNATQDKNKDIEATTKEDNESKVNLFRGVMKKWIKKVELIHKFSSYDLDEEALNKSKKINYVKQNIKSNSELVYNANKIVENVLPDLIHLNIPKIQKIYPYLTRKILYDIFCQFKCLMKTSIINNNDLDQIKKGVDFKTFKNGVKQMVSENEELAKQLFDVLNSSKSGYLSYDEFMKGMIILKSKNIEDKVNLFFKIIDSDGNGLLSWDECELLSYKSLKRSLGDIDMIIDKDDRVLNILASTFAIKIFNMVDQDKSSQISLPELKSKINVKGEEAQYLEMFCCADLG